jgi:hypothetical protein
MQKLRIMTSNCISQHSPLGASSRQKNLRFEASADQTLETGAFKVVREYSGYCVQCTSPLQLPFSKIFKDPWSHAIGRSPLNSSNLSLCPFILFAKFLLFLMTILEAKIFKIRNFFYIFWKVWTTNTLSLNSWVVEAYISIRLENGYVPEEKHG